MLGLMMDVPLLLSRLIDFAAENAGSTEVVGRNIDGHIERCTWFELRRRALLLAKALAARGHGVDSRIGSLAWNTIDHVELFCGALGIGASLHTINPRLTPDHLAQMINQVDDQVILIDPATITIAESLFRLTPGVRAWIYMGEGTILPYSPLPNLISKAAFVATHDDDFVWPQFDERQAATICYTSGTTGLPKGVVYSHRSITLNAMNMTMADMLGGYRPGALEVAMPLAPISLKRLEHAVHGADERPQTGVARPCLRSGERDRIDSRRGRDHRGRRADGVDGHHCAAACQRPDAAFGAGGDGRGNARARFPVRGFRGIRHRAVPDLGHDRGTRRDTRFAAAGE